MKKLEKRVQLLTYYAMFSSFGILAFIFSSFTEKEKKVNLDELTVKRINIIENDGTIRMVLANKEKQHSGRMDNKDWENRERHSGMIFFNDEGDECGGLIYGVKESKGKINSGMSLTMDKYKDDQVVQILNNESYHNEKETRSERGIIIKSYPENSHIIKRNEALSVAEKIEDPNTRKNEIRKIMKEMGPKQRLFLGQTAGNSSALILADKEGTPKIMLFVDDQGTPQFQVMDEKGNFNDLILTKN